MISFSDILPPEPALPSRPKSRLLQGLSPAFFRDMGPVCRRYPLSIVIFRVVLGDRDLIGSLPCAARLHQVPPLPLFQSPCEIFPVTPSIPGFDADKRRLLSRRGPHPEQGGLHGDFQIGIPVFSTERNRICLVMLHHQGILVKQMLRQPKAPIGQFIDILLLGSQSLFTDPGADDP